MGSYNQAFMDHEVTTPEQAEEMASAIVAWLVDAGIIEDRPYETELDDGPHYSPGPRFTDACVAGESACFEQERQSFLAASTNGMRLLKKRGFVLNWQGRYDPIACPHCSKTSPIEQFWEAGGAWFEGKADAMLCEHCGQSTELPRWEHPEAGFVMLAFEFWDWCNFTEEFKNEFRRRLGHRMTFLYGKF
jgi:hypothetical protein